MNSYPVQVRAVRDAPLSRWLWLVKWLLLVPHYIVLALLWVAFVALTLVAYVAVLFAGRYPHSIFVFNVGVLRWSWRVSYYGYAALGTDRYPPFTLAEVPDYPAGLHVDYPPRPPRWLPLVAWLFAAPHLLIVAALTGGTWQAYRSDNVTLTVTAPLSVAGAAILIVAIGLLFTGRYPRGLFDLLVGIARWSLRVTAYVALLTAVYPPLRLDQGETEPDADPSGPSAGFTPAPGPTTAPTAAPTPSPSGADGPGHTGSAVGRVTALVVGVLLLLVGVGTGIAGATMMVLGSNQSADGYLASPTLNVSTPTAAVVSEDLQIHIGGWARNHGTFRKVRITASSTTGKPVFLGIASQSDVNRMLAGTAHDQLTGGYNGNQPRFRRATGAVRDLSIPAEQTLWLAQASGRERVAMDWKMTDGNFAVVLANADGTPGVAAELQLAAQTPNLRPLGIGLLVGAGLLCLVAVALVSIGASGIGSRRSGPPPDFPAAPPPAPPIATQSRSVESLFPGGADG